MNNTGVVPTVPGASRLVYTLHDGKPAVYAWSWAAAMAAANGHAIATGRKCLVERVRWASEPLWLACEVSPCSAS